MTKEELINHINADLKEVKYANENLSLYNAEEAAELRAYNDGVIETFNQVLNWIENDNRQIW